MGFTTEFIFKISDKISTHMYQLLCKTPYKNVTQLFEEHLLNTQNLDFETFIGSPPSSHQVIKIRQFKCFRLDLWRMKTRLGPFSMSRNKKRLCKFLLKISKSAKFSTSHIQYILKMLIWSIYVSILSNSLNHIRILQDEIRLAA